MTPEDHRAVRESLGDYAIGRLPQAEATAVRTHLDGCAACRTELAEVSSVLPALASEPPPKFTEFWKWPVTRTFPLPSTASPVA